MNRSDGTEIAQVVNPHGGAQRSALDDWLGDLCRQRPDLERKRLESGVSFVARQSDPDSYTQTGMELASLISELQLDMSSVLCGLVYRYVRSGHLNADQVSDALGPDVVTLLDALTKMANVSLLEFSSAPVLTSESRSQIANVRKMLVALIDDVRVAVIKMAERVVALRHAKHAELSRQLRIAQECMNFFAPLASRLGTWRLKWELEDLSLRYLEPDTYASIAQQLEDRRVEREKRVEATVTLLQSMFNDLAGKVRIEGRAKHIYSIWRKMNRKGIRFSEVYDVNAVRILVPDIADCYLALGRIHTRWHHIPREFDDYIANPKNNGYRSLHTAVNLDEGRVLEVQIKTHDMHREAELGVCAHWAYKDNPVREAAETEDQFYNEKLNWLRKILAWSEESGSFSGFREELRSNIETDRIYVYTPKGHVLDLTVGATPIDFAYRVHTEVGNRCCAARVDGQAVPLNSTLETGQCVEILVDENAEPDRNWLNPALGFISTARARAKIQSWFKQQTQQVNIRAGQDMLREAEQTLGLTLENTVQPEALGFDSYEELFYALSVGDLNMSDILRLTEPEKEQLSLLPGEFGSAKRFSLRITAKDRANLLRDITQVLSAEHIQMLSIHAQSEQPTGLVHLDIDVETPGMPEFARLLDKLEFLDGITHILRSTNPKE